MSTPLSRLPDRHAQRRRQTPLNDAPRRPHAQSYRSVETLWRVVFVVAALLGRLWQAVVWTFVGRAIAAIPSPRFLVARGSAVRTHISPNRGVLGWLGPLGAAVRNVCRQGAPQDTTPRGELRALQRFTLTPVRMALFIMLAHAAVLRAARIDATFHRVTALGRATAVAILLPLVTVAVVRDGGIAEAGVRLGPERAPWRQGRSRSGTGVEPARARG
jgi:hypothetical protein